MSPVKIVTRGSALALTQTHLVRGQCEAAFPGREFAVEIIKTTGDKLQTASLAGANLPKGLFTKELEQALLDGLGDLAVHSLKDLPTTLPDGLVLGAVSQRADVRDVLIYRAEGAPGGRGFAPGLGLSGLPANAVVGTSSTRRAAQLLALRPDIRIVPIRGNVGTRLRKVAEQGELDATILAAAGLERLRFTIQPDGSLRAMSRETQPADAAAGVPPGILASPLSLEEMLPCVGQAALGIEVRANDSVLAEVCSALNHFETAQAVLAERAFLQAMGGGCQLAVAALAEVRGSDLVMRGVSFLGAKPVTGHVRGSITEPQRLGEELARMLQH